MKSPLVSVAIITYNHGPFIRQCLEGILMQKVNFPFEVIIGEDCSTDDTRSIIQEFEKRYPEIIKPVYHNKNVGAIRNAYEFCFPRLTGKYVAVCEGDDYWTDPDKLQKQVDFLDGNPDFALCFHKMGIVNNLGEIVQKGQEVNKVTYYTMEDVLSLLIPTMSIVFRNCIRDIPKELFKVKGADTFLVSLLANYGRAADLGFVGAYYRTHPGGVFSSLKVVDQFQHSLLTRKVMRDSSCFSMEFKKMIQRELLRRKILYIKYFIKKRQILNSLKIAFT